MVNGKVDISGLRSKFSQIEKRRPGVEKFIVSKMGVEFIRAAIRGSPVDTGRYESGWSAAGNASGVGLFPRRQLKRSKFADTLAARLDTQVVKWEKRLVEAKQFATFWNDLYQKRYVATGRRGKWATDCRNKAAKAQRRVDKIEAILTSAREQVSAYKNGDGAQIVIFGKKAKSDTAKSSLVTVRAKIYGGDAKWSQVGGRTFLTFHNAEPHATIVESHRRVVANALRVGKGAGVKRYSAAAIRRLSGGV